MVKVPSIDGTSLYLDLLKKTLTASVYDESAWTVLEAGKSHTISGWLRATIINALAKKSILAVRTRPFDNFRRTFGDDLPMIGFTMAGHCRLNNLQTCIESVIAEKIPGDFVECGVWRGGSSIFAKALFNAYGADDRRVWLADSFKGMPVLRNDLDKLDPDYSDRRYFAVSRRQVEDNFRKFDLLDGNVRFLEGWFSESLPTAPVQQIAILRLDGDYYNSTMDALINLHGKLSKGGFVIIDDYNDFKGCKFAVDEFRASRGIKAALRPIDHLSVYWRE